MNITKTFVDTTNMLKLYILNYIKILKLCKLFVKIIYKRPVILGISCSLDSHWHLQQEQWGPDDV